MTPTHHRSLDLTALEAPPYEAGHPLEQVVVALNSSLDLAEVLQRIAEAGRDLAWARRSVIFLLDGEQLEVAAAAGTDPDEDTLAAVSALGPIALDPIRWARLSTGRPLGVDDAEDSDIIPALWRSHFDPGAVALVPLVADGHPCGLMALDWSGKRHFLPDEMATFGAFGACAGLAVRNARLFQAAQRRAQLQQALTRGATTLVSMLDPGAIAENVAGAYTDLIGARVCAIALLDVERSAVTTVASRGTVIRTPIPLSDIPEHIVERIGTEWERAKIPLEMRGEPWLDQFTGGRNVGAAWYLLLPLVVGGHSRGCVFLGFEDGRRLGTEERLAVRALADIAAAALERGMLLERQERRMRQLDALYRVSAALTEGANADALVSELNALLGGLRVEVVSIAFRDARLAARLGAEELSPREFAAWRSRTDWAELSNGHASIPMRLGNQLFGVLRVRPSSLDFEERVFLETLARELAEVVNREIVRSRLEDAARDRALGEERDRLASDLHDTAGQVFVAIGLVTSGLLEELDEDLPVTVGVARVRELADRGKNEIDEAARALAFLPATRRGLVPAVRALAGDIALDGGIDVRVDVRGDVTRLSQTAERGLYKVAHEALANAWRHAECESVRLTVDFGEQDVTVEVADDGKGLGDLPVEQGAGMAGMYRTARTLGGTFDMVEGESGGVVVRVTVPRRPA